MNKFVYLMGTGALLAALSGCIDNLTSDTSQQSTNISSYSVTGTSEESNGVIPISASTNSGNFSVSWNVPSPSKYHISLYLSEDNSLSSQTDINLSGQNCGLSLLSNCGQTGSFNCKFTTRNKISCDQYTERDISFFLDQIPKTAYLFIEVCDSLFSDCKTDYKKIEFQ